MPTPPGEDGSTWTNPTRRAGGGNWANLTWHSTGRAGMCIGTRSPHALRSTRLACRWLPLHASRAISATSAGAAPHPLIYPSGKGTFNG